MFGIRNDTAKGREQVGGGHRRRRTVRGGVGAVPWRRRAVVARLHAPVGPNGGVRHRARDQRPQAVSAAALGAGAAGQAGRRGRGDGAQEAWKLDKRWERAQLRLFYNLI